MKILIVRGRSWLIVEARLLVNTLFKTRGERIDMKCFLPLILGRILYQSVGCNDSYLRETLVVEIDQPA